MIVDHKYGANSSKLQSPPGIAFVEAVLHYSAIKTHPYNIRHLFMSVADNANMIIEMYHIMHSVQSSVQSSIDDVISYCKMRQAKLSYNLQLK